MTTARSPRYRQFLKRLRAARREAGLTQVEVGRAAGSKDLPKWMSEVQTLTCVSFGDRDFAHFDIRLIPV